MHIQIVQIECLVCTPLMLLDQQIVGPIKKNGSILVLVCVLVFNAKWG